MDDIDSASEWREREQTVRVWCPACWNGGEILARRCDACDNKRIIVAVIAPSVEE